jgi:GntR family transcriptional regulator / MocR family aminotransferase
VHLPPATDERAALRLARSRGVALYGLSEHSMRPQSPALLLGYGRIAEPAIEPGVRALAAAVNAARRSGSARA